MVASHFEDWAEMPQLSLLSSISSKLISFHTHTHTQTHKHFCHFLFHKHFSFFFHKTKTFLDCVSWRVIPRQYCMFSQREDNTEAAAVKGILREISDDEFTLRSLNLPGNEVWYRFPTTGYNWTKPCSIGIKREWYVWPFWPPQPIPDLIYRSV